MTAKWKLVILSALVLLIAFGAWFAWYKFFRVVEPPPFEAARGHSAADLRFMYGSVGAENDAGIPYWIIYVLPHVFKDKLPGPGGYASFGFAWEEGQELPVGFTKKKIGFDRVAQNCAICHTARVRLSVNDKPRFYPTAPNHTFDLEAFFRFLVVCAKDPRFNPDTLMPEIEMYADLSCIDKLIYRYALIPIVRKRLLEREPRFAWIFQHGRDWPDWGRGRDDAMNLTKYFLTTAPLDPTLGPTDMPSVWNLRKYDPQRNRMNLAGDSYDAHSVIIDSTLGLLGAAPPSNDAFLDEIHWLEQYLLNYPPPKYPCPIDGAKAAAGKAVFDAHCSSCHWSKLTGTVMPVNVVGTDVERIKSWNKQAAIRANNAVKEFGIERRGLVEQDPYGYVVPYLDGIWLRAPYLHNGSVPNLRELLNPAAARPKSFYRGYDVYDPANVGFITQGAEAMRAGTPYDVTRRSNSNQGHEYGVNLPPGEKDALLEFLKTM